MNIKEFEKMKRAEYCTYPLNRGRGTQIRRLSRTKVKRGVWPAPVYEAHMSDGEIIRMSFWTEIGRPFDVERARRLILSCTSQRPGWRRPVEDGGLPWEPPIIRYGAVHHNGSVIVDDAVLPDLKAAA